MPDLVPLLPQLSLGQGPPPEPPQRRVSAFAEPAGSKAQSVDVVLEPVWLAQQIAVAIPSPDSPHAFRQSLQSPAARSDVEPLQEDGRGLDADDACRPGQPRRSTPSHKGEDIRGGVVVSAIVGGGYVDSDQMQQNEEQPRRLSAHVERYPHGGGGGWERGIGCAACHEA